MRFLAEKVWKRRGIEKELDDLRESQLYEDEIKGEAYNDQEGVGSG